MREIKTGHNRKKKRIIDSDSQTKLVWVIKEEAFDVVMDLHEGQRALWAMARGVADGD